MTQLEDFIEGSPVRREGRERHRAKVRAIVEALPRAGIVPERERLHAVLDALLDLKEEAAADPIGALGFLYRMEEGRPWDARIEAVSLARSLVRDAAGWTSPPRAGAVSSADALIHAADGGLEMWRSAMAHHLARGVHAFPPSEARALAEALLALNDATGETPPLLTPSPKHSRQGRNPLEVRRLELMLLCYVEHRHWAGERKGIVQAVVADAVGRTAWAVMRWKAPAIKAFGKESVERALEEARQAGAAGEPFSDDPDVLAKLAAAWRAAVGGA